MRRVVIVVAVVVLVAAEAFLGIRVQHAHRVADDNRAEVAHASRSVDAARAALARGQAALARTRRDIGTRAAEAQRAQTDLEHSTTELAHATHNLASANATVTATAASLATLDTCVTGAQRATFTRNAGDIASAINLLKFVQPVCASLVDPGDHEAAVFPFDFSDPSVLLVGDTYYAYSTNSALGDLPVISSTDLVHWTIGGNALPKLPAWATGGATWAPSVAYIGSKYDAYYTVHHSAANVQCISVGAAHEPTGPFVDTSKGPLVCQPERGGSIDPQPYIDAHGHTWLIWASGGAIWGQTLRADGLALTGKPSKLIEADQRWEDGVVEAPSLVDAHGTLVLLYSGNHWSSADYAVGEAVCATPTGPCVKTHDGPVFTSHGSIAGPGSATAFTSPHGDLWLAYNAYAAGHVGYPASRLLHVSRLNVDGDAVSVAPR